MCPISIELYMIAIAGGGGMLRDPWETWSLSHWIPGASCRRSSTTSTNRVDFVCALVSRNGRERIYRDSFLKQTPADRQLEPPSRLRGSGKVATAAPSTTANSRLYTCLHWEFTRIEISLIYYREWFISNAYITYLISLG